ncbi:meta/HslJ family protein 1, partial [Achromobacter sp. AGC25]
MPTPTATSPASPLTLPAYHWRLASASDSSGKPIAA